MASGKKKFRSTGKNGRLDGIWLDVFKDGVIFNRRSVGTERVCEELSKEGYLAEKDVDVLTVGKRTKG